jgi:hypothetical protein
MTVDRFNLISAGVPMVVAPPKPTVTEKLADFKSALVTWTLTGLACAPPLVVMLHPGLNDLAHRPIQDDFAINTPGLKWMGVTIVPSWQLYRHAGPRSGGLHTSSGFDQTSSRKGMSLPWPGAARSKSTRATMKLMDPAMCRAAVPTTGE